MEKFEESWGWTYWNWNYIPSPVPPVNLITVAMDGTVHPTKHLEILENAISDVHGKSEIGMCPGNGNNSAFYPR